MKAIPLLALVLALMSPIAAQQGGVHATGIKLKKPVFGGACRLCPWGAMAQTVKDAMRFYGYDVQICHNCNAAAAPVIVSEAKLPPPYRKDPAVSVAMAPPNKPGLGPIDFGATAVQFLCGAYDGTGIYARQKAMKNLRLIANIQSPWYLVVAARTDSGITDFSQVRQKHWPVRIFAAANDPMVKEILAYYGLSVESITSAGGYVGGSNADLSNFDLIIHGGFMTTAPEFRVLNEVSQKYDLTYLELPDPLLAKLAQEPQIERGTIPVGLFRGVERTIPTVVRDGTVVYTRDDVPDSFAYDVARAMDQHQDLLQWTNQDFSYNVHNVWKACGVPLHPGAARYYREAGYMK
ncbi:MAG: TAXI family TRAP transporter solute-binding subunit [Acidobacteriota bacterium]